LFGFCTFGCVQVSRATATAVVQPRMSRDGETPLKGGGFEIVKKLPVRNGLRSGLCWRMALILFAVL
jgi:hypothetical protein